MNEQMNELIIQSKNNINEWTHFIMVVGRDSCWRYQFWITD